VGRKSFLPSMASLVHMSLGKWPVTQELTCQLWTRALVSVYLTLIAEGAYPRQCTLGAMQRFCNGAHGTLHSVKSTEQWFASERSQRMATTMRTG
jgi:hypothetical protein